jgi:hypothetical protein
MLNYNKIGGYDFISRDLEWLQITPVICNIFSKMLSNKHRNKARVVFISELKLGVFEQELLPGSLQLAVLEPYKTLAQ